MRQFSSPLGATPSGTATTQYYSTRWWNDYGAEESTYTDNRATLVVDNNIAYIRIDTDRNTYKWLEMSWWNASSQYPAYIWVAGTISAGGWSQAFSGKHTQTVRADSFRTAPNFMIPDADRYTIDYTIHQNGAYWDNEGDDIDKIHSDQVTVPVMVLRNHP